MVKLKRIMSTNLSDDDLLYIFIPFLKISLNYWFTVEKSEN